ncbi:MAG: DUF3341 domain-containing protein [Planctomycetes bacterium]|nr:DUF3341 domain-containing protein [Planctomycetota bacterium]
MSEAAKKLVGLAGLYDQPDALIHAAEKVRDAGYRRWDCHTPYPVHGLDHAMGIKESPIPYFCLTAGFIGVGVALLMQWWMSAVDYPVRIGGKPLFSWPAFVPITFELFVLFAALATMGSILVLCKLGRWHSPLHDTGIMGEVTSCRYAVVLEAKDRLFTEERARAILQEAGCTDIRPLFEADEEDDTFL